MNRNRKSEIGNWKQITWISSVSLLLAVSVVLTGCDEDNPPPTPTPVMTILEAPAFLASNVDSCYLYRVRLENAEAESVLVEVRAPGGSIHSTFALYDDGGPGSAYPDYACAGSGDIVPNDGRFARRINARLLADNVTGDYTFIFRAPGVADQSRIMQIRSVLPCSITEWPQVTALDSCFGAFPMTVRLFHPPEDSVTGVEVWLWETVNDDHIDSWSLYPASGDTVWETILDPAFVRCAPDGDTYRLVYSATTLFGHVCQRTNDNVSVSNPVPVLSNSTLPDTIIRPTQPGNFDTTYVTVNLADCELAEDTSFVGLRFDVSRDDTLHWGTAASFFLRDNGRSGDAAARDQIYTVGLLSDTNYVNPDNVYYFRFYAVEGMILGEDGQSWACPMLFDTSAYLIDSVRLIQPGSLLLRPGTPAGKRTEPEFRVLN